MTRDSLLLLSFKAAPAGFGVRGDVNACIYRLFDAAEQVMVGLCSSCHSGSGAGLVLPPPRCSPLPTPRPDTAHCSLSVTVESPQSRCLCLELHQSALCGGDAHSVQGEHKSAF